MCLADISISISSNRVPPVMLRFLFALLHADTSDCLLSPLPHPLTGPLYFYDLILLKRSHPVASCLVRYSSGVAIRSPMYDTHLRATHTTTSSIGGVQIPIYLVSSATDSIRSRVVLFKTVTIPTSDVTFSCCPTTRRYIGLPSLLSPPSSHRASVLLRSNLAETIPSCCLLPCTIFIWCHDTISHVRYTSTSHSYDH